MFRGWGILLLVLVTGNCFGQTLVVRAGGFLGVHLHYNQGGDSPINVQNAQKPAVKHFFGNSPGFIGQIGFRLKTNSYGGAIEFGLIVDRTKLSNKERGSEYIMGEELTIESIMPYVSIGSFIPSSSFIYGLGAVGRSSATGRATVPAGVFEEISIEVSMEADYDPAILVRIGMGIEAKPMSAISVNAEVLFDIRSFRRGTAHFFDNGSKIAEGMPTGIEKLDDPTLSIVAKLSWQLPFSKN